MEAARKVKEHLTKVNDDPTTMQQIYYYGKFIVITAAVIGFLYLCYKYDMSTNTATSR